MERKGLVYIFSLYIISAILIMAITLNKSEEDKTLQSKLKIWTGESKIKKFKK